MLKVRLYRPWSKEHFLKALPKTVKKVAVMDRTKEPGALGDPLYLDVATSLPRGGDEPGADRRPLRPLLQGRHPDPDQGRLRQPRRQAKPRTRFTVGIEDDVTHLSLKLGEPIDSTPEGTVSLQVLGARLRRHRRRQQGRHQDHRRRDADVRAGLLRLRLQEVGRHHHLAPALRQEADPELLLRDLRPTTWPATTRPTSASTTS